MPQEEITNNRPKNYSKWHRDNFPSDFFMTDGDWFEQRKRDFSLKTVAYIETIQIPNSQKPEDYPVWDSKKSLLNEISNKMNIPAFIVWHYQDCSMFFVQNIKNNKIISMNANEYIQFIRGL